MRSEAFDQTPGRPLRRVVRGLAFAGVGLALYGTVLVLVMIGGLKFTAYEADAIRPLVETSPLLSWAYTLFSVRAFSNLLGVVELATALLLALAPVTPRLGLLGGALAVGTFAVTLDVPGHRAGLGGQSGRLPGAVAGRRLLDQGSGAARYRARGRRPHAHQGGAGRHVRLSAAPALGHRNHKNTAFQHSSATWQVVAIGRSSTAKHYEVGAVCTACFNHERARLRSQIEETENAC